MKNLQYQEGKMKKRFFIFAMVMAFTIGTSVGVFALTQNRTEVDVAYCTIGDLQAAYGEDRITGWSRLNPDTVERAITSATAEIDGYLLSGGYTVPLPGPPRNLTKYCVDIASANLIVSAGALDNDPGGQAVLDEAKNARRYLEKVAEGKFKIPGSVTEDETARPPGGNVAVRSPGKMDLWGY
jgi:phage gp36-like protein